MIKNEPTVEDVITAVERATGLFRDAITNTRNHLPVVVRARAIAFLIARRRATLLAQTRSWSDIADSFGAHGTSAMRAADVIRREIAANPALAAVVELVEAELDAIMRGAPKP